MIHRFDVCSDFEWPQSNSAQVLKAPRIERDMGGSSYPGWYFLVFGQIASWVGLGGSLWLHYQDQRGSNQLREIFREGYPFSRPGGLSQAAKLQPGDPDPGLPHFESPLEDLGRKSEKKPAEFVKERDALEFERNFWRGLFLGGVLVIATLIIQRFLSRGGIRGIEEEAVIDPSSPVQTKQELAARQLAEVRLKRHGFDQ